MVAINFSHILEFSHVNKTRGHAYKLFKARVRKSLALKILVSTAD